MSTVSSHEGLASETAAAGTPGWAASGDSEAATSGEALAARAVAFSNAFEKWSGRKALAAGASMPRLNLLHAVHCRGPQKMVDLADALMTTPRNVTAIVDGLEAEGLVRRIPHSTDRRVTLVELTCESSTVARQFEAYQASLADLFAGLDETDRASLGRLLETLTARIRADCPSHGDSLDA